MEFKLNEYIDHTLLKPDATYQQIIKILEEAKVHSFKAVCINPTHVALAAKELKDSPVRICTVIGFPLGANSTSTKVVEAKEAIENGAHEIDMVINIGALKSGDENLVFNEISDLRKVCSNGVVLKVIVETALLSEEEKITICQLVTRAGADFIKTSTGFASGGATLEDIQLFRNYIGPNVQIKASGGIRNQEQAIQFINAGVSRIGTSNGTVIVGASTKNGFHY